MWPAPRENMALALGLNSLYPELFQTISLPAVFPDLFKSQLLVSCLTLDHSLKLTSWIWQLILLLWLQSLALKAAVPYVSITAVSSTPRVPAPSKANQDPSPQLTKEDTAVLPCLS